MAGCMFAMAAPAHMCLGLQNNLPRIGGTNCLRIAEYPAYNWQMRMLMSGPSGVA